MSVIDLFNFVMDRTQNVSETFEGEEYPEWLLLYTYIRHRASVPSHCSRPGKDPVSAPPSK